MACACQKNKAFEVKGKNGRTVYTSASEPSAWAVAKRYPDSEVWKDGVKLDAPTAAPAIPPSPPAK